MITDHDIEAELRTRLERVTSDVPQMPELSSTIARGRRRRALRQGAMLTSGVAAVAVVAASAAAVGGWVRPGPAAVASTASAVISAASPAGASSSSSSSTDWVAGSTVDETMAAVVAAHVARPGVATDIYPSDWARSTPLPDAEATRATEWQAHYRVDDHESLTVFMSQRPTDAQVGPPVCTTSSRVVDGTGTRIRTGDIGANGAVTVVPGQPAPEAGACGARQMSDGMLVLTRDGGRTTVTLWRSTDATVVTVTSDLGETAHPAERRVSDAELEAVATDPRLAFAHVTDPPAWPASNGPGWPSGL